MSAIFDSIRVERPTSCEECPLGGLNEAGQLKCGTRERDTYVVPTCRYGSVAEFEVRSPQEALDHNCFCHFIKN